MGCSCHLAARQQSGEHHSAHNAFGATNWISLSLRRSIAPWVRDRSAATFGLPVPHLETL